MKLENQVCTRQQGERLKELGIKASSVFYWGVYCPDPIGENWYNLVLKGDEEEAKHAENVAPAFSVAELGVMLPTGYDTMRVTEIDWQTEQWHGYDHDGKYIPDETGYKTEAQCRADIVISLLENNVITPVEVNQRLNA